MSAEHRLRHPRPPVARLVGPTTRGAIGCAARLAVAIALAAPRVARAEAAIPAPLADVGIDHHTGASLPVDAPFLNQDGHAVRLGDHFEPGRPVILVLAYFRCPMLCPLVLSGVQTALRDLPLRPGEDYRLVVLSIDPEDTVAVAAARRDALLRALVPAAAAAGEAGGAAPPVRGGPAGVDFLVGDEAAIRRVASAAGFRYHRDPLTGQYAHAAGLFVATPGARISRTFTGAQFPRRDLELAIVEASEGKLGGLVGRVLLFCFHYDPDARGYVLASVRLMQAVGALTVLGLAGLLAALFRVDRRGLAASAPEQPPAAPATNPTGGSP